MKKSELIRDWCVRKIAVIGPGVVGMPMAAMLAYSRIKIGNNEPAKVIVIQRNSPTSGWKVDAINAGKSSIGGIEPELEQIISETVKKGLLSASHDYKELRDADVIIVCVQTDKKGFTPDYGPLFASLEKVTENLKYKPKDKVPLIIFESTLAPSTMLTMIKNFFEEKGLEEGKDILLGNSPNRVMPGRLVERLMKSDKLVAGLRRKTAEMIEFLYSRIIKEGTLHVTNSLTAEIVKTLENAYRDVRIAFTAEIARFCDKHDINFYEVRDHVNNRLLQIDEASTDPNSVPYGGLLIPTIGVGGHCLPKDGILMLWRMIESNEDTSRSLFLESRRINDESPVHTIRLAETHFGSLSNKKVALLGVAYRFNSNDTRNSPTIELSRELIKRGCVISIHDPYVKEKDQNIKKYELQSYLTNDLDQSLSNADFIIICTAHRLYLDETDHIARITSTLKGLVDGCNIYHNSVFNDTPDKYIGIGRGKLKADTRFIDFVYDSFQALEFGVANELERFINFLNKEYAFDTFNKVSFQEVQHIAGTCSTGCMIVDPRPIKILPEYDGFSSRLIRFAYNSKDV